jgi:serine/threonine protein kinase/tetratricopeptide (TPR) repeat protein
MIDRIGRFAITRKLGEGGMGIVYAAHDPRLDRNVAIKTLRGQTGDEREHQRLWREARAAAKVSHPNVCQLYEIGEEEGVLFLAMELLEGEPLADRIARGPIPLEESAQITLAILGALEALHNLGVVHRDLKPSNVFLTPVGVKLLDFGLARPVEALDSGADMTITQAGTVVGTPRYMAPELWRGDEVGPPDDLFAVGALAYEMLTGRPAFEGHNLLEVYENILTEEPPPIVGSAAVEQIDRIVHRALRKKPSERFAGAERMAAALRSVKTDEESGERIAPRRMIRLIGVPLRVLRPDADTDFLSFSIPDAVTSSLASLGSLAVRSSASASRFAGESLDLARIAAEADVDMVLSGTLMRAADQLRVNAQLLEAPAGTVLWSQTFQAPIDDLFDLQDTLTARLVESLAVPLSSRERAALRHDTPASAQAYEFYLRANRVAYDAPQWELARDLYRKCLDLDPLYAPAWARLGRVYRAISIYMGIAHEENYRLAQDALRRAIELNANLAIAHNLYTYLEVEMGRAQESMQRLIERVSVQTNDPELLAGLVQACRYCGLLDESIAAYGRARRVDPGIRTSVSQAYLMRGDFDKAIETNIDNPPFPVFLALELAGRTAEAIEKIRECESAPLPRLLQHLLVATRSLMQGNLEECRSMTERLLADWRSRDPCGLYYMGRHFARMGDGERALSILSRSIEGGYYIPAFLKADPWLDSLRGDARFAQLVERAEARHAEARRAFAAAGGDKILGLDV